MHFCNDCGSTELGDNCFVCKSCKIKRRKTIKHNWNKQHPHKLHEYYIKAKNKRQNMVNSE